MKEKREEEQQLMAIAFNINSMYVTSSNNNSMPCCGCLYIIMALQQNNNGKYDSMWQEQRSARSNGDSVWRSNGSWRNQQWQ